MDKDKIVDVQKLIYQLLYAKVVIDRICENPGKDVRSRKECVPPNGSRLRDSIQRYCPQCKALKADKHGVRVKKCCTVCESTLKYMCSKCNCKQYVCYKALTKHWNICELTDSTIQKFNPTDFLVVKASIDFAMEIIRYCSKCNEIDANCSKWKAQVCLNCDQYLLYKCNRCKTQFNKSNALVRHMRSKCFPGQYKCNQCDFTNPSWDGMRQHLYKIHRGTKTHCPKCGSLSKNEASLRYHLRYCGVEPKFNCNDCEYKTKHRKCLRTHMKTAHGK